mmetsp:Transcript_72383/g.127907  ORF Transcript_72383/g.127907 Transcript_72383/m.127907 type:complete len:203 (-) Transcript_72383:362-970(-)
MEGASPQITIRCNEAMSRSSFCKLFSSTSGQIVRSVSTPQTLAPASSFSSMFFHTAAEKLGQSCTCTGALAFSTNLLVSASCLAKISALRRCLSPEDIDMEIRPATPQLSKRVSRFAEGKKDEVNRSTSRSPMRMIAAFVLPPRPSPSQRPAASPITQFKVEAISAPAMSCTWRTWKLGLWNSSPSKLSSSPLSVARVASQK